MRRTNIYLEEPQLSVLKRLGERRGEPVASLIRQAVNDWLAAQGAQVIDKDQWAARFDVLMARRRTLATGRRSDEAAVERDVATAVREVRRRRSHGTTRRR